MKDSQARADGQPSHTSGTSRIRFRRGHTCPVCGGCDDAPRGQGRRCHGFIQGDWIHCSREEYSGQAPFSTVSQTWSHKAKGKCPCGVEHAPAEYTPSRSKKLRITHVYKYRDREGKVVHETVRYEPKDFRQRRPLPGGGYAWNLSGIDVVLYNLPTLCTTDPEQTVYIVEGEKDADRLGALGLIATTNPMGAKKWGMVDSAPLHGRPCVIVQDNDQKGREHTPQVAASLYGKATSVKILDLPGLSEHGDISDYLDQGHTVEQLVELAAAAPEWIPHEPHHLNGSAPSVNGNGRHRLPDGSINYDVLTADELNIQDASTVKIRPIKWLWPYRLAEGEMALVAGEGGLGKSQVMLWVAAAISNGAAWPDKSGAASKGTVLIVTAEDSAETTIVPRLLAVGADLEKVKVITAPKIMIKESDKAPLIKVQWLQDLGYWRRACDLYPDLKLLIMDPIVSYLGRGINDQKNDEVRSVIEPFLDGIIKKRGICFLANTHLNKSLEAKNIVHRITGSIAYVNIPRNVHIVFRDADNPETRIFAQCKCNNAPDDLPALKFRIEAQTMERDGVEVETSKPVFSDELVSPLDLKRIMAADRKKPGPAPTKLPDVAQWVFGKLKQGPMTQYDLINDARDAGHLPPVTEANPKPSKTNLYDAVKRFPEFVPGWTIVDTTIGVRKAWELVRGQGDDRPPF
jgi:putative DNA primase/helicase